MQYQVPQYIDVEDKVVGPLTLRQFFYLAGAFAILFLLFFIVKTWLWIILAIFIGGLAAALAFIKYNGQPLTKMLRSIFSYFWRPRFYSWQTGKKAELGQGRLNALDLQLKTSSQPIGQRQPGWLGRIFKRLRPAADQFEVLRKISGEKEVARRVDYR